MSNTTRYEFNAPKFQDFTVGLDESDGADTFFDVESEVVSDKNENKENKLETLQSISIKKEIISPATVSKHDSHQYESAENIKSEVKTPTKPETPDLKLVKIEKKASEKNRKFKKAVRRLSEVNDQCMGLPVAKVVPFASLQENLSEDMKNLTVKAKKRTHFEGITIDIKPEKQHTMTTRKDEARKTPTIALRTRVVNKDCEGLDRKRKIFNEHFEAPLKYMAMAEKIHHFQKDTPPRFRSSKRRSTGIQGSRLKARQSYNPRRTIAVTPKLLTSMRKRPIDIPSKEERMVMELEDLKRHQVKAIPLNEKALQPPKPVQKSGKPTTKPDPFNITQVFKKPAPKLLDSEPFKFTAKPLPKTILEKRVGVGEKKALPITVPESPAITKSARFQRNFRVPMISNDNKVCTEDLFGIGVSCKFTAMKNTEVKPFSFEIRDKEMREKKEMKIQKILEEEKKLREFKANPAPSFSAPKESIRLTRQSHLECSKSSLFSVGAEDSLQPFKAKSPKVLRKAPFKPNLEHTHSQPLDIQLNTERRLAERQEFELKQLEKEEQLAILREQVEMEKREKEKQAIAKLRQETIHKAQPMPKFKQPAKHVASKIPLTDPQSPRFTRRTRTDKQCSIDINQ